MKLERKDGHGKAKKRQTPAKPEYENPARLFESKATGRPPLPTNSSLQTLKLQPHASPHLGTDLRIAQLSNIGSFDHHLSTPDCASRQTPEPKIESTAVTILTRAFRKHSREYVECVRANLGLNRAREHQHLRQPT
ncbi:hypothetical protein V1477_007126 [Vespula maculifrons]|uniref:Uncharacterized protein n=1 Tax=Vespula maculifrons TaxID=7453 RepID=A0ABD2CIQ6_VESMC